MGQNAAATEKSCKMTHEQREGGGGRPGDRLAHIKNRQNYFWLQILQGETIQIINSQILYNFILIGAAGAGCEWK